MVSTEVKRTIVKSPPELWEQVSDQETLMRHLGQFGEIRITRSEPEKIVEWETEQARGKVQMKPSGWGTQVLLSVTRELPEQAPATSDQVAEPPTPLLEEELEAVEELTEPETHKPTVGEPAEDPLDASEQAPRAQTQTEVLLGVSESAPEAEIQAAAPPAEPEAEIPAEAPIPSEPAPRRGFFARLFKRRHDQSAQDCSDAPAPEPTSIETPLPDAEEPSVAGHEAQIVELQRSLDTGAAETEPAVAEEHGPAAEAVQAAPAEVASPPAEQSVDLAAELAQAEELLSEQTAVVLTSMLDRLGAAHHRPFSRG